MGKGKISHNGPAIENNLGRHEEQVVRMMPNLMVSTAAFKSSNAR